MTRFTVLVGLLVSCLHAQTAAPALGIFEEQQDVGTVLHPGTAAYDPATRSYTISGSGENMWLANDAFHFVWKKMSGDVTLTADVQIFGEGGDPHRKAVLMIRQSLDPDSAYADAALHGEGLTSLQFRYAKGETTHEVQANVSKPGRLSITKRGRDVYLSFANGSEPLALSGSAAQIDLAAPFYVGIGVCAHNKDRIEQARFSNVELVSLPPVSVGVKPVLRSTLETMSVSSTDRRVVYTAPDHFEAPNWTRDGRFLIFNSKGRLYRIPPAGGPPELIDTGSANRLNNDHGISFDGSMLAVSDGSQDGKSRIYTVPIAGGTPRRITENAPSYWHGWSPDGKTLAFCGERNGEFDIYSIPAEGGTETRLTTAKGLDDGPEYSPDGRYVYFNSERTGHMQIWRMRPNGSEQEQVTSDDYNNWFPHLSPDGKLMVFLTYEKDVTGHPENKNVMLRLMNLADEKVRVLAHLFGGQGTINVPSWSQDSKRIAFVSYQLLP